MSSHLLYLSYVAVTIGSYQKYAPDEYERGKDITKVCIEFQEHIYSLIICVSINPFTPVLLIRSKLNTFLLDQTLQVIQILEYGESDIIRAKSECEY